MSSRESGEGLARPLHHFPEGAELRVRVCFAFVDGLLGAEDEGPELFEGPFLVFEPLREDVRRRREHGDGSAVGPVWEHR